LAIIAEEFGRQLGVGPLIPVNIAIRALAGDPQRHGSTLSELVSGTTLATWAVAESAERWSPDSVTLRATPVGTEIELTGTKRYVESALDADIFVVVARTGSGLTQVVVPASVGGVRTTRSKSLDLRREFGTVTLDHVRVPLTSTVGALGDAQPAVQQLFHIASVLQCAESVGVIDRMFEMTRQYMDDRVAFGRPLAAFQVLKHRAADLLMSLESAKAITDAAIAALDSGSAEAPALADAAQSYVSDLAPSFVQECLQIHGGIGYTWEHQLHLFLRRATVNRMLLGSPEQRRQALETRFRGWAPEGSLAHA
jgi:alkylation response protein AidB-like acyl-CoA dehydrogenase